MADESSTPASGVGRMLTRGVAVLATIAVVANLAVGLALGSTLVERWPPELGVALVATGVLVATLILPLGGGAWVLRRLQARDVKVRFGRTLAGLLGGWNIVLCGLLLWGSPEPVSSLMMQRGTWAVDVITGRGPFGPAAVPVVEDLAAEARKIDRIGALAPFLTDDSAAAVAAYWLVMLDGTGDTSDELEVLHHRYRIDMDALRSAPSDALPDDGRTLLVELSEVLDAARKDLPEVVADAPTFQWPDDLPDTLTATPVDRTTLALDARGWEARYEDGDWRLQLGDSAAWVDLAEKRLVQLAPLLAQHRAEQAERDAAAAAALEALGGEAAEKPEAPAEPSAFAAVRESLGAAARGRYGALAGTTAYQADWPDSLTRASAVAEAEQVRAWCVAAAADDPLVQDEHAALLRKYGLPVPDADAPVDDEAAAEDVAAEEDAAAEEEEGAADPPEVVALDEDQRKALGARGRRWLSDVLGLCEPVVVMRQHREKAPGQMLDDARRARWARLDAEALVDDAVLVVDGEAVSIDAAGRILEAVRQDGGWRISW